jgi:hypothetical protein
MTEHSGGDKYELGRLWTVFQLGRKVGEVRGAHRKDALQNAHRQLRIPKGAEVDIRPRYPRPSDRYVGGSEEDTRSTPHDAHVIRIALELLQWSQTRLRAKATAVRYKDLKHLLEGHGPAYAKTEVWRVLTEHGCDLAQTEQFVREYQARVALEGQRRVLPAEGRSLCRIEARE